MEASDRLKLMVAADTVPKLSDEDIEELLAGAARNDSEGRKPEDDEWEPTYNLRAAARMGWRVKMGRAAHLVSADMDGDRMSSDQIFEHCREMVRQYGGTASPVTAQAG